MKVGDKVLYKDKITATVLDVFENSKNEKMVKIYAYGSNKYVPEETITEINQEQLKAKNNYFNVMLSEEEMESIHDVFMYLQVDTDQQSRIRKSILSNIGSKLDSRKG